MSESDIGMQVNSTRVCYRCTFDDSPNQSMCSLSIVVKRERDSERDRERGRKRGDRERGERGDRGTGGRERERERKREREIERKQRERREGERDQTFHRSPPCIDDLKL